MSDQFEYESLSDHLSGAGLTLEIDIPTGGKIAARQQKNFGHAERVFFQGLPDRR